VDRSQSLPLMLVLISSALGAAAQYLYKYGSLRLQEWPLYKNIWLLSGMLLFGVVMLLFVMAFKMGGRLSVVYPAYATTFLWASLLGILVDKEAYSPLQAVGMGLLLGGVFMISYFAPSASQ